MVVGWYKVAGGKSLPSLELFLVEASSMIVSQEISRQLFARETGTMMAFIIALDTVQAVCYCSVLNLHTLII